ncbi:hypothetical protein [Secundilactobacillus paracollinoides]|uniref:hypothetical protein n=1 Tax=Secundilactobacillus paracollinoides TaxID=240427 RepID=UPI0012E139F8|nr:hypothetical protein [Secundilactobacillus paracollinoides]
MMDKSVLEKRIHDKAEERADKYFETIRSFFGNERELVNKLALKPSSKEKMYFRTDHFGSGIFDNQETLSKHTNWQDIRKELVEKYEKEETDNILDKLDSINYLLEGK